MKARFLRIRLLAIIVAPFLLQLTACTDSSLKFDKAELKYIDLSDNAELKAQPVKSKSIELQEVEGDEGVINIYLDTVVHSNLSGIGGAFNEQGGEAFMKLSEANRKELTEALFSPTKGSGFAFCRTAVGASDFGLSAYSYSETPEDYEMKDFSVERDTKSVIPFILAAKAENPDMQLFASPWSPPGWMKVSGKMDGGKESPETNILRSTPEIYKAYGLYFSKYCQEYAKQGVTVDRLVVQNETDMNPPYPGCDMLPAEMSELITNYIKPQFAKDGVETEVWAGSFRGKRSDAQNFMKLENANDAIGLGLQYCPQFVLKELRENYPNVKMMHTEGRCENGKNSMEQARKRFGEIATWINSGCENYCFWNIVLNETSTSGWGWKQNSLINIDRNAGVVTYNPDYAPVSLLSRYIRPGDECLKVETKKGAALAIRNNERLVVFLQNNEESAATRYLKIEGKTYSAEVPAQSLCALVFKN
jgi:glucosylceramidase